eukprot:TRINITY_DN1250_c0_g5_i1.p1 TRINITY_DN1250_c0_g5~~TRINITY_DN1250_c0_g5_i1.p1  ORF type:complete len:483 (+),score=89.79 TRINITY_DN1250_c0_g5_i1:92-1540(+)
MCIRDRRRVRGAWAPRDMVTTRSATPVSSPEIVQRPSSRKPTMQHEPRKSATGRQPDYETNLGMTLGTSLSLADRDCLKNALREYKYVSPNLTLFELLWLNPFWEWCQRTMFPKWLAPNVITFSGFIGIMLSFTSMLYLSPELDGSCPQWWYLFTAFTCFFYQTMDGSDGKQARATKSGSPLGELFDHGVDALVTPIYVAFTIELQGFGISSPIGCLALVLSMTAFAMSNLTLLHLGKQEFNRIDCQEVQVIIQLGLVVTTFYPLFWTSHVPVPFKNIVWMTDLLPRWITDHVMVPGHAGVFYVRGITMLWSVVCMSFNVARGIFAISSQYFVSVSDSHEYTSTISGQPTKEGQGMAAFLHQLLTLTVYVVLNFACWSSAASSQRITADPWMPVCWMITSSFTFGDLMDHLLFTRVGQLPFPQLPFRNRGVWLLSFFWLLFGHDQAILAVTVLSVLSHLQYCTAMGGTVCSLLKIRFFSIPY